jgi:hypothetical protein
MHEREQHMAGGARWSRGAPWIIEASGFEIDHEHGAFDLATIAAMYPSGVENRDQRYAQRQ